MSWDKKHHGDKGGYFYLNVREGGQVVKRYLGRGERAQQAARAVEERRQNRQAQRDAYHNELAQFVVADTVLQDLTMLVAALVRVALVAAGYHQHHRSWRRRRHVRNRNSPRD